LGEKALSWVTAENTATVAKLGDPKESPLYGRILSILENKEKIPMVRKIGDYYYNFWQVCEKGIKKNHYQLLCTRIHASTA
jgi:prolyl oligopeptidase